MPDGARAGRQATRKLRTITLWEYPLTDIQATFIAHIVRIGILKMQMQEQKVEYRKTQDLNNE